MKGARTAAALAACGLALAGASCGGTQEREPGPGIPARDVRALNVELKLVQDRLDVTREERQPGSCGDIEVKSYPAIEQIIAGLPANTDRDRVRGLRDSIQRLRELTNQECSSLAQEIRDEEALSEPETTETIAPETTETVPPETETETVPTETEPPATVPTVPEEPVAPTVPELTPEGGGAEAPGDED